MTDPRFNDLARTLVHHSTRLVAEEHVLIEAFDLPEAMVVALVEATRAVGAHPHVSLRNGRIVRALVEGADGDQLETWAGYDLERMKKMDVYIGLRGSANASEMAGLADAQLQAYVGTYQTPVHGEQRVKHTRWCVLRWPSASMAQLAQKSTAEFEDFYFRVCTLDYAKMAAAVVPLQKRMAAADAVHIKGPGDTDLRFSLKGIDAVSCTGSHNIPDGECFSAPVRNSVNGVIHYNTPTVYMGRSFENVRLTFKNGRIEDFTADQGADDLAGIFNTDEGARFVGEFAIGFNPHITHAMRDILFDEKVSGSLHFTPGRCYDEADNGNISDIHWDLVLIQREDFGGGEIWFDDELIRKDGLFVVGDLLDLNPDRLACVE